MTGEEVEEEEEDDGYLMILRLFPILYADASATLTMMITTKF